MKQCTSENREIGGALALDGCRFMMRYNDQPIVGVCGFNDDRAEAWSGRSVWGGCSGIVLAVEQAAKKQTIKNTALP
jgi:hypothetical protein